MRLLLSVSILALAGCQVASVGIDGARAKLDSGDLLGALVELDAVPPHAPEYGEARSLAIAVERRIRTSQRLFARGLALRAQWQDEEAVRCFELAREVWPEERAALSMIEATRHRMAIVTGIGEVRSAEDAGAVAQTRPVGPSMTAMAEGSTADQDPAGRPIWVDAADPEPLVESAGDRPDPEMLAPSPLGETVALTAPADSWVGPAAGSSEDSNDEVRATPGDAPTVDPSTAVQATVDMGGAEAALLDGRLDDALQLLRELHEAQSGSQEVRSLLVRALHQRALLHYGQGELARAVECWGRLLEIEPSHVQAREFREAARSELDALRRR